MGFSMTHGAVLGVLIGAVRGDVFGAALGLTLHPTRFDVRAIAAMLCLLLLCPAAAAAAGREGPCDILHTAQIPCVAAHSTTRALFRAYHGPLYQVTRMDGAELAVGVLSAGGAANSTAQDMFCGSSACIISRIYDQSPMGNHLDIAPGGPWYAPFRDKGVNATRAKIRMGGRDVYAARFEGGMGYRNDNTSGVPTGDAPETIYMVADGKHFNAKCCFDYGNAETNVRDDGAGTMEAVTFTSSPGGGIFFPTHKGTGKGPWVMADLENGLFGGNETVNPRNTPIQAQYVVAMLKGRQGGTYALKGGDAQGGRLKTLFDGPRSPGYIPMRKQGAIILGIGGDNTAHGVGTFLEGIITAGGTSDTTDDDLQANIVAAGYGR